ncbi:MAG TPA: toll/interleukin-1 receptor domain-containing protein [Thermoanaerobaculia bacterium]|nr:toll/interleukin-1 receptor domain-containing protein [Thermoanaerobaculia bacterium]
MADIFISYSHEDVARAEEIERSLLDSSTMTVWRDVRMAPGTKFEGVIQEELRRARVCLVLVSRASLASEYCQNEVGFADANGTTIVPVRLDDCTPAGFLASRSYLDMTRESSLFMVVDVLRDEIKRLRQDDLRDDYLEMYRLLLAQFREGTDPTVVAAVAASPVSPADVVFEDGPPPEPHYARVVHEVPRSVARDFCAAAVDFLERGGSCLRLLPVRHGFNHLPVWLFRRVDLDRDAGPRFTPLPDAVLLTGPFDFDNGVIVEASLFAPTAPDTETPRRHGVPLPVDVEYNSVNSNAAADLGWISEDSGEHLYAFVLSKGVYRVERAGKEHRGASRLILTKYLGMQSARLRLFAGSHDVAHRPPSNTLQLTYLRYTPKYFAGGTMQFLMFNDQKGIAVVSAMRAVVHEVTPRAPERPPGGGAGLMEYRYTVTLQPKVGDIPVTNDRLKYGPGDVDMFSVEFDSPMGYDYVVSIEVSWHDAQTGAAHTLRTPKETVSFPLYEHVNVDD